MYGINALYLSTYADGCRLLVYGINALSPASIAHVLSLAVPGVPCAKERNPRSGRCPAKVTPEQVAKVMQSTFTRRMHLPGETPSPPTLSPFPYPTTLKLSASANVA